MRISSTRPLTRWVSAARMKSKRLRSRYCVGNQVNDLGTLGDVTMQRRPLDFHDFDSVVTEIDRLQKNSYDKAGQWDLGLTCDHLNKVMRGSLEGFPFKGPWFFRVFLGPIFKGLLFKQRRMREGFKAPSALIPSPALNENAVVSDCKNLLARVRDHQGDFHPNPFLGRLSPEEWRQLHLIHSAHHLSFLVPKA